MNKLEKFNKEKMEEFEKEFQDMWEAPWGLEPVTVMLVNEKEVNELRDFIYQTLLQQKELIIQEIREKIRDIEGENFALYEIEINTMLDSI